MKFRKKPIVVEAVRWTGTHLENNDIPEWFLDAVEIRPCEAEGAIVRMGDKLRISTKEGMIWASPGDWVIKGVQGELYPCKPDIFAATYEDAE